MATFEEDVNYTGPLPDTSGMIRGNPFMEGIGKLAQNKLFAQYLASAGADLAKYGANTNAGFQPTEINAVTNQSIKAQNAANAQQKYLQLVQSFLGPDKSTLTVGPGKLAMNITSDSPMFKSILGGEAVTASAPPATNEKGLADTRGAVLGVGVPANPFSEGQPSGVNFSPSDLAGLTPEDLYGALSGALNMGELRRKVTSGAEEAKLREAQINHLNAQTGALTPNIEIPGTNIKLTSDDWLKWKTLTNKEKMDLLDAKVKGQQIKESEAKTRKTELETPSVEVLPGILLSPKDAVDYMSIEDKQKPDIVKVYEYARSKQGFKGDLISFKSAFEKTSHKKDYEGAVASGYNKPYWAWLFDMAKAGAINLGGKVEEKRAFGGVERENKVRDPKLFTEVTETLKKDDRSWRASAKVAELVKQSGKSPEEVRTAIQRDMVFREIDNRIKSVYEDATFIRGKGWVTPDGLIIQRDPYGK